MLNRNTATARLMAALGVLPEGAAKYRHAPKFDGLLYFRWVRLVGGRSQQKGQADLALFHLPCIPLGFSVALAKNGAFNDLVRDK
jgi:hypothetical protein